MKAVFIGGPFDGKEIRLPGNNLAPAELYVRQVGSGHELVRTSLGSVADFSMAPEDTRYVRGRSFHGGFKYVLHGLQLS